MSQEANGVVLEALLPSLPHLRGLHVIGCPKASHSVVIPAVVAHAPLLKELSFTIFVCPFFIQLIDTHSLQEITSLNILCSQTPLPSLRHLAIDVRTTSDATAVAIASIFVSLTSLSTLLLKFSDRQFPVWNSVIDAIPPHGVATVPLRHLSLMDCAVSIDTIRRMSSRCKDVERLELPLPIKEMVFIFRSYSGYRSSHVTFQRAFTTAISGLDGLHTLIDVGDAHASHGPRASLTKDDVKFMMRTCVNLKKVVSDGRMWTVSFHSYPDAIKSFIDTNFCLYTGKPNLSRYHDHASTV